MTEINYGNCQNCNSGFDRVFKIDTRMQEYYSEGKPLHCLSYNCGSTATCNVEDGAITNLKMKKLSYGCNRIKELEAQLERYEIALNKLARLGNGDQYGTSDGNRIAQHALKDKDHE